MLREGCIIHPFASRGGLRLVTSLVETFGDATVTTGQRYWHHAGANVSETVRVYTVAYDADDDELSMELRKIALQAKADGTQITQYVRYANGAVEILD